MNAFSIAMLKKLENYNSSYKGATDKNGERDGFGTCNFADGSIYEGNWNNGLRNGYGKYTFSNGAIYDGNWENDLMHGKGKLSIPQTN